MPRPASKFLTEAELRIMRILWRRGAATIADLGEDLKPPSARATIQTMLRIMERKRYVKHRVDGRSFVYRAVLDETAAGERAVKQLLTNFYPRTPGALVMRLLNAKDLKKDSIERVRRILDEGER
jgi:BlaI family penicillinase repressor